MKQVILGWKWWVSLGFAVLLRVAVCQVPGAVVTTTVQDTVYRADGTPAGGTVLLSWGAFTTADGESIAAGSTSVTLGANGALHVALAPNAGATPMGSYYTAVLHLNDGTTSKQYWVVPMPLVSGAPVKLASIQNQVLPTSVAMQTVSKQYVDNAISQARVGLPVDSTGYVRISGDTMTGPLVLPGDPVAPLQASDKNYVDTQVASVSGGLGGTVRELPSTTQVVSQPSGTQLDVNLLNGEVYASQYVSGAGDNGITNALNSADCASGCRVQVEPTYSGDDAILSGTVPGPATGDAAVVDERGGSEVRTVLNPLAVGSTTPIAEVISMTETLSPSELEAIHPGAGSVGSTVVALNTHAAAGGNNQDPVDVETLPYGKNTYGVLSLGGSYNTQGQHIQLGNEVNCFAVGDCLAGSQYIFSSGGYRDPSDEGTHPYDLLVAEDSRVFDSTCASGCTTGSTMLVTSGSGGTQGDGRYLIDMNPAKDISNGLLIGGGKTIFGTANFSGTSFPVSVFLTTAQSATSQPMNMAPGTVTLPIATSGVAAGYSTSTAALPATTGVACVADVATNFPYFETAAYSVVDATHIQLTLNKPHMSGATVAVGGLCGYGLEQTVDTVGGIRQVFPVIGSTDATDLYYADALTTIIGRTGSTSGYINLSLPVSTVSRVSNVVTATIATNLINQDVNGLTVTVSGVADPSYNGNYPVYTTSVNTLTYSDTGPDSTSTGGTISVLTGGYVLYPMAEVLNVYNPATKLVDGTFQLAANTVPWAAGDAVEEPHYFQQVTAADTEGVVQYVPRPSQFTSQGKTYQGEVGPGFRGWQIQNGVPENNYIGAGGTHHVPDYAYSVVGAWLEDFDVEAGTSAVIHTHCNLNGCNRWDSDYDLFLMDSAVGVDGLSYAPESSTVTVGMRGTPYAFSPTAFTAGTINVGTLNATTITGGISGGAIHSGTIGAAYLPLFGPSGTTHAPGIVPDPGATAGATRYLREDGTWDVPAGGSGGSPTGAAGGDLSGSYPNPTVAAVHATSGTIDGVTVGGTTPEPITATTLKTTSTGGNSVLLGGVAGSTGDASTVVSGNGHYHVFEIEQTNGSTRSAFTFSSVLSGTPTPMFEFGTGFGLTERSFYIYDNDPAISSTELYIAPTTGYIGLGNGMRSPAYQLDVLGDVHASGGYVGPSTAPSGSCTDNGAWVFSQDGHATFCASGTWVTKI